LNTRRLLHGTKRDRILARNILILISIFLFGGIPIFIYIILSNKIESLPTNFYLFTIATPAIAIIFEKITIVILNEEIRKVINQRWIARQPIRLPSNRVVPISSSKTMKKTTIGTISKSIPTPIAWQ
jgi:ABC-type transport system involved in multi-copper enzyme maturation permease subunit